MTRLPRWGRRVALSEVGIALGSDTASGAQLWGSLEDSYLVVGPPRVGKDVSLIVPTVAALPGPVAVASNRPDTLAATLGPRQGRAGPLFAFDPQHQLPAALVEPLRWSPVRGCEQPATAILRGRALAAGAGTVTVRTGEAEFWETQTAAVLRCYLHAAAVGGRGAAELLRWSQAPATPEPVRLLHAHGRVPAWADELAAQMAAELRLRDNVWSGVRRALDCLADPAVLDACDPAPGDELDPEAFLACGGTLYLLGSTGAQASVASLITALVEDLVDAAGRIADRSPGGRLDPPLGLVLNEAANLCPLPSLPTLLTSGGGRGITTMVVLQSLGQARHRWGEAAADAMWDGATAKLVFGGLAQADDLARISRLAGEFDEPTHTRSRGAGGDSVSTGMRRVPVLGVEELRSMAAGRAALFYRHLPPIVTRLTPWWDLPIATTVRKGQAAALAANRPGVSRCPACGRRLPAEVDGRCSGCAVANEYPDYPSAVT